MSLIAMIPARMGSQRLKRKNLAPLLGEPLIVHAIRKCRASGLFDAVWVNSEHPDFGPIAQAEGAQFHRRPEALGNDGATSEQFVAEFLESHPCERLFQVHSIAPLLDQADLDRFVRETVASGADTALSVVEEPLECLYGGEPVNFTFTAKQNSQDLTPIQRIVWAVTSWRSQVYLDAFRAGGCATYAGSRVAIPVGRLAGHVIKTQDDLDFAAAVLGMRAA